MTAVPPPTSDEPDGIPDEIPYDGELIPLALGNWWEYRIQEENVFTDSTVNEPTFDLFNDDFESTHVWAVTAEELVQGRIAYRVEVTETIWTGFQKGNVNSGVFWISVSGDSLLHVGSEGIGRFRTIIPQARSRHKKGMVGTILGRLFKWR